MGYGQQNLAGAHEFMRVESRTSINSSINIQLQANVHDALWILSRQNDIKEFVGENAGSAIKTKVNHISKRINKFKNQNGVESISSLELLEPKVEKLKSKIDIMSRLQMGRYWNKLLKQIGYVDLYGSSILAEFKFSESTLDNYQKELINSNSEIKQISTLLNGKVLDGWELYKKIKNLGTISQYNSINIDGGHLTNFNQIEGTFLHWVVQNYVQSGDTNLNTAWKPESLKYDFKCSVQENTDTTSIDKTILTANDYQNGKLDWYSFNYEESDNTNEFGNNVIENTIVSNEKEYLSSKIKFKGALSSRWWEFDDSIINLSAIKADKYNIAKLLTINHLLNFSHDWQIIPLEIPQGSLVDIESLVVTDVFGDEISISQMEPSPNWNMFSLNKKGDLLNGDTEGRLFIPPTIAKRIESKPIEEVLFMRDEMANMVWGIEKTIPSPLTGSLNGDEAINNLTNYYESSVSSLNSEDGQVKSLASRKFTLSSEMPENWIPFIPIKMNPTSFKNIEFQRATFYRIINKNNPLETVRPKTNILLADGSKLPETPTSYFINEEEILQNGVTIKSTYQRARDYDGSVRTWLGRERQNGKSERSRDFKFDTIQPFSDIENTLTSENKWSRKADIPLQTDSAALFTIGNKIFLAGGTDGTNILRNVREFDPITNLWISKSDCLAKKDSLGCTVGDNAYVIGGLNGSLIHKLYKYTSIDDSWSLVCDLSLNGTNQGARQNAVFVHVDGKLYYGLGELNGNTMNDWWVYDINSETWASRSNPSSSMTQSAYFVIEKKIYVLGGLDNHSVCRCYDTEGDNWTQIASLPDAFNSNELYLSGGFALNSYGYICCGAYDPSNYSKKLWQYDPLNDAWCEKNEFPGNNVAIQSCTIVANGKAYIVGGKNQSGVVINEVWEYSF